MQATIELIRRLLIFLSLIRKPDILIPPLDEEILDRIIYVVGGTGLREVGGLPLPCRSRRDHSVVADA